ncbi:hypothetical protein C8R44DRAFT_807630 [Mycena epipterygia]|nr:hypothetical protein C8R44DRAFT_807630 [Mycena epipterygia]
MHSVAAFLHNLYWYHSWLLSHALSLFHTFSGHSGIQRNVSGWIPQSLDHCVRPFFASVTHQNYRYFQCRTGAIQ